MTTTPVQVAVPAKPRFFRLKPLPRDRYAGERKLSAWIVVRGIILGVLAAYFIVPIIWMLLAPTKTDPGLVRDAPLLPGSLENLVIAWNNLMGYNDGAMLQWVANSAWYTVATVALTLAVSIPAGYALAMFDFRARKPVLVLTLVGMIMPASALVLPLFLSFSALRLTNTAASVIIPSALFPFGVYLTYVYFASTLPVSLLEAARIDGASEWQIFRSIALPLARPAVALVTFFAFLNNWNNFFLPYVMLTEDSKYPLQVGLGTLASSSPAFHPGLGGAAIPILKPELALAGLIVVVPIIVVFLFSQRALVRGMLSGSVKD